MIASAPLMRYAQAFGVASNDGSCGLGPSKRHGVLIAAGDVGVDVVAEALFAEKLGRTQLSPLARETFDTVALVSLNFPACSRVVQRVRPGGGGDNVV